jgi:hypothetical protein
MCVCVYIQHGVKLIKVAEGDITKKKQIILVDVLNCKKMKNVCAQYMITSQGHNIIIIIINIGSVSKIVPPQLRHLIS